MFRSYARTFALSGIFLLFPLFGRAKVSSFPVGIATAAPGQKSASYLEVPAGVDAATNIPAIVINNEERGPALALVSGAHGTEYTSIIALGRKTFATLFASHPISLQCDGTLRGSVQAASFRSHLCVRN